MSTYLTYDGASRTESNPEVIANLVRKGWVVSELPVVEEVPPTFTAEDWTSRHFTAPQILALQRFEFALQAAGKPLGSSMGALKTWLEQMLLASADPTPRSDWSQPPCEYAVAASEAVAALQS